MSLKAFHLIFVTALTALAFGCGVWRLIMALPPRDETALLRRSLVVWRRRRGILVIIYGLYFLKKLKK